MQNFSLYSSSLIGDEFRYPEMLIQLAENAGFDDLYPWVFLDASTQHGQAIFKLRNHDGRDLIPFAQLLDGQGGDIACFDAADSSGDPEVIMLIIDGSERSYYFRNFACWFDQANKEAYCTK